MSTADVSLTLVVDARPLIDGLEAALVAVEPTPLYDALLAEYGPGLVSARNDAAAAQKAVQAALGSPA